jgi:hypothetical protein
MTSSNHFVVSHRDTAWQFSFHGDVTAPFTSRQAAIEEAIKAARATGLKDIEVLVQSPDFTTETVWPEKR